MCILQALRFSMSKLVKNGPNNDERKGGAGRMKVEEAKNKREEVGFCSRPF